jgi:hypothetical protein
MNTTNGLGLNNTTSIPSNKENANNPRKSVHENLSISTTVGSGMSSAATPAHLISLSTVTGNMNGSANYSTNVGSANNSKMSLKAREFGKEITNNAPMSSGSQIVNTSGSSGLFSSGNIHPQTVKHANDHSHHYPHTSNIIVSVASNGVQAKKPLGDHHI